MTVTSSPRINQRWAADMGLPGPDAGNGGKHLLLPPRPAPSRTPATTYTAASSNRQIIGARSLPVEGDVAELFFGPTPPEGKEGQWIQTLADKGWFVCFRICGPEAAAFNGDWKTPDFPRI